MQPSFIVSPVIRASRRGLPHDARAVICPGGFDLMRPHDVPEANGIWTAYPADAQGRIMPLWLAPGVRRCGLFAHDNWPETSTAMFSDAMAGLLDGGATERTIGADDAGDKTSGVIAGFRGLFADFGPGFGHDVEAHASKMAGSTRTFFGSRIAAELVDISGHEMAARIRTGWIYATAFPQPGQLPGHLPGQLPGPHPETDDAAR